MDGLLANSIQPWGLLAAPVNLLLRDPQHTRTFGQFRSSTFTGPPRGVAPRGHSRRPPITPGRAALTQHAARGNCGCRVPVPPPSFAARKSPAPGRFTKRMWQAP